MKRLFFLAIACLSSMAAFAQSAETTLDEQISDKFKPFADLVAGIVFYGFEVNGVDLPIVLIILVFGALFFTLYFRFPNFRLFGLAINIVRGKYSDPKEEGEISHFQALSAALSATVGLGNIAGVAVAISLGGPGATFWMILAGLIGMSSKFTECTLGVKYRSIDEHGRVLGGPMEYLRKGLVEVNPRFRVLGMVLAVFFSIMCIGGSFGGGCMFQVNQAFEMFNSAADNNLTGYGALYGVVMAVLVGFVIIGGIKRIGTVAERIVPAMVGIYVAAALVIIFSNYDQIPAAFAAIFSGAFAPQAITGGFVGVLIQGFRRAAFSNEAGIGSAPIAHAAVKTEHPASEGIVALLEPFIDTVVVCTMTALVIIITGVYESNRGLSGVDMTSQAFESVMPAFKYVLTAAVMLFSFSTMLSWSYYGLQSWKFLFGTSTAVDLTYKVIFCLMVILGAAASLQPVIDFSDAMIFAMLFPNMIGLFFLLPKVKEELNSYLGKIRSGEIKRR